MHNEINKITVSTKALSLYTQFSKHLPIKCPLRGLYVRNDKVKLHHTVSTPANNLKSQLH